MDLQRREVAVVDRGGEEAGATVENVGLEAYGGGSRGAAGRATLSAGAERAGAVVGAAGLSLVATLIHLWVMPGYAWIWWGYGVFFLAAALGQGLLGVAILRWPAAPLAAAGIFGNLAVILVYVYTRTSGIPYGPHAGKVEETGLLGMTATVAEMGLVVVLVTLLGGAYRRAAMDGLLLVGAAVWALRLLGFLS